MKLIRAFFIFAMTFSTTLLAEQLRYQFDESSSKESKECRTGFNRDEEGYEKKRRTMIENYHLSRDLKWKQGSIKNEWGDNKETFCYLESGGKAYIYRPSAYIIFGKDEIRTLTN
jgi:hypothetical protein